MNPRIRRLMERSKRAEPAVSTERPELITRFYREHEGRHPAPILRALAFRELCEQQTIYIGDDELIVGERGPAPKAVPTYPELTCHTADDLRTLNAREHTRYRTAAAAVRVYERDIIPYWRGRAMRGPPVSPPPPPRRGPDRAGGVPALV